MAEDPATLRRMAMLTENLQWVRKKVDNQSKAIKALQEAADPARPGPTVTQTDLEEWLETREEVGVLSRRLDELTVLVGELKRTVDAWAEE